MSRLRGIKRIEFPLSVRKKALVRCSRDAVPHREDCGIQINAWTGIIHDHGISAGLGGELTLENAKVQWKRVPTSRLRPKTNRAWPTPIE